MTSIRTCRLPESALLRRYQQGAGYADCYTTEIGRPVSQAEYVAAFYTTRLFKLERLVIARLLSRPSTDAEARGLASGVRDSFAAWHVEARAADQLLLCDLRGSTRSWLMSMPAAGRSGATRLFFGSAVVPVVDRRSGERGRGWAFRALLGFHKLYSRLLLRAAVARLASSEA
jgi:hypothetical protein